MVDIIYYGENNEQKRKGFDSEAEYQEWLDNNKDICVLMRTPKEEVKE